MSFPSLLAELEVAVKIGTPEKRVDTLRRITNLFLKESNRLNEEQIGVFDNVLIHLLQRIETKALVQLSSALAPVDNAPIEVVRRLSRHDEITVAEPVLTTSNRLTENDLIEVAKFKSQGHLFAISVRASLSETVTDVLIDRGDTRVHHSLARNPGGRFSDAGYSTLVKKSETDETLAERLGLRLDIPIQLLRKMLARASNIVRSRLLAAATPESQEKIHRALANVDDDERRETANPRNFQRADNLVLELNRRGKLTDAVLLEFVKDRKYEEMTATLALFCGVKSDFIERILKSNDQKELIVACKAANLNWATVELILKTQFSYRPLSEKELGGAKDSFLELTREAAQRSIRFLQTQDATKQSD